MKKQLYMASLIMINMILTKNTLAENNYENCYGASNCQICGINCKYTQTSDGKVTVYGPVEEGSSGAIQPSRFESNNDITSVVIQGNIENIGTRAFYGASNLKSVIIGDSVKTISAWAFRGCSNLEKVVVGDGVKVFQSGPFIGTGSATIYCSNKKPCTPNQGNSHIVIYTKDTDTGIYSLGEGSGETFYLSATDMTASPAVTCGDLMTCQATVLLNNNVCDSESSCKALVEASYTGTFVANGKFFSSLADLITGNYNKKRIYTVEEAEKVSKTTGNTVKLRYK